MTKAGDKNERAGEGKHDTEAKKPEIEEKSSETQHAVTIDGQEIAYTAKAGTLILKDDEGNWKASIFYVAYTKNDVEDVSRRPITFSFNGGPGSSSVWLHLGVLGPRRVAMAEDGEPPPPPPFSWSTTSTRCST